MVFELLIKPIVFVDIDEAVEYYENQLAGLGKRFYNHFLASLREIQNQLSLIPTLKTLSEDVRLNLFLIRFFISFLMIPFPYKVLLIQKGVMLL